MVKHGGGAWYQAVVEDARGERLSLRLAEGGLIEVELRRGNHAALRLESKHEFEAAAAAYTRHVAEETRVVEDAITGKRLDVAKQALLIGTDAGGAQAEEFAERELKRGCLLYTSPSPRDRG